MADMLIPNKPQKGRNIDEILANLPKEGEETKALPAATAGFSIQEFDGFYRITGISYREKITAYDFAKIKFPKASPFEHINRALNAKPDDFRAASAPLIYAICKTLYKNKDGAQKELVEKAHLNLEDIIGFGMPVIYTISVAAYNPTGPDEFIHDFKQSTEYKKRAAIVGKNGYIIEQETNAAECVQALLDTTDKPEEISAVFEWFAERNSYVLRLQCKPDKRHQYVVSIGRDFGDRFCLDVNDMAVERPAFGVREYKIQAGGSAK